ncbi:C4-dicarboxylate TRAP transporter substrate-binding protein [Aquisalimonas sp.]|uniref:C4-dicarboxylate TRAP transporter substrate-binding protein n=1 Tax=unclassified Aquisalimonas TaxID=2644645 RepID=UPI0025B9300B|nr:C4-dicarboxylate TRAP transporter substrate-binding protein [Aquisalimonas sp.]
MSRQHTGARAIIAGSVLGLAAAQPVAAQSLNFASGYPADSITAEALEVYADRLQEYADGALSARLFHLSLLNLEETSGGLRDGIADLGIVLTPYFPGEFPHMNMIAELSMLLETEGMDAEHPGPAFAGAMMEYVFFNCSSCREDFQSQNQVFLGGASSPEYALLCTTPVTDAEAVEGKRLRVGGAQWARWADAMGASPASMSVNEINEGLSQGVVDCSVQSAPELSVFQLFDVVEDITVGAPGGVFAGVGSSNINADTWRGLDDQQREALLRASAVLSAEFTWRYESEGLENLERAEAEGITVHEADGSLIEATQAFIGRDVDRIADSYAEDHGVADSHDRVEAFRPILERWVELTAGLEDADALAELYWNELLSELDPADYGL